MKMENKKIEKVFDQALNFIKEGKSVSEIYAIFPKHQEELKELFEINDFFKEEKDKNLPSKEELLNIFDRITFGGRKMLYYNRGD